MDYFLKCCFKTPCHEEEMKAYFNIQLGAHIINDIFSRNGAIFGVGRITEYLGITDGWTDKRGSWNSILDYENHSLRFQTNA